MLTRKLGDENSEEEKKISELYKQFSEIKFQSGISAQSNIASTRQPSIKWEPNDTNSKHYINL